MDAESNRRNSQEPLLRDGQPTSAEAVRGALPFPTTTGDAGDQDTPYVTKRQVLRQNNMMGSAVWLQALALLFMATIWSMVLAKMPLSNLPLFGYHPLLQSLSLVLLAQSILVLQPTTLANPSAKTAAFQVHQLVNLFLVLPLFTAGATIMWYLHDQPNSAHFISWHGILGTAFVCLAWVQAAVGAASVWFKGKLLGGEVKAKGLWKWHRLSGYVLLSLAFLTFYLGALQTTWGAQAAGTAHRVLVIGCLLGVAFIGARRVKPSKLPKIG